MPIFKRGPPPEFINTREESDYDEKQQVKDRLQVQQQQPRYLNCQNSSFSAADEPLLPRASPSPASRRKGRKNSLSKSDCTCEVCRFRMEHRLPM